jgi:hypothetical protein
VISYNIFFSAREGIPETQVTTAAKRFLDYLLAERKLRQYRILQVTNPASFQGLPRFQAIADFASQQEMDESFAFMNQPGKVHEGVHGELVSLVTDFKVSFTADI